MTEEILPVDSVIEYFTHFPVLEIDFSFYRPFLENSGQTTQNYHLLEKYRCLKDGENDFLITLSQGQMRNKRSLPIQKKTDLYNQNA